jgi:preprotein translocase subunit SecD
MIINKKTHTLNICLIIFGLLFLLLANRNIFANDILLDFSEKNILNFHLVDEEATDLFNLYYNENPEITFNEFGELQNPYIIPCGAIILGVYENDLQKYNLMGNLEFVVIRKEISLSGNHIIDVQINEHIFIPNMYTINFTLDPEGGEIFFRLTSFNIGRSLAIVWDNKVIATPFISDSIRDQVSISGIGVEDVNNIYNIIKSNIK